MTMTAYKRFNGISGKASGALVSFTLNGTTATFSSDPGIPTIASPDLMRVTIAGGTAEEEIVDIIAHTSGATTATVIRNVEPTQNGQNSAAAHTSVDWSHAPTAAFFVEDPSMDIARRGGLIGVATAQSPSAQFTYGQVEVSLGDSIGIAYGSTTLGKTDRWSILMQQENNVLGLPNAGRGLMLAAQADFTGTAGDNLTQPVAGDTGVAGIYQNTGVLLSGTLGSSATADSLTFPNVPFGRALIFYDPQSGSDGIGVSYLGVGGAVTHIIDGSIAESGGDTNVAWFDTLSAAPAGTTTLSLTRQAPQGSSAGGTTPKILGVRFYGPGLNSTVEYGLTIDNIGAGGVTTGGLLNNSARWGAYLASISKQVRRVHLSIGGDDLIVARTNASAASYNNSPTITDSGGNFTENDLGRPVSGTGIPANSYVGVINSNVSIGISSSPFSNVPVNTTGGSLIGQTVIYGQVPIAQIQANLAKIILLIRNAAPKAEIVIYGEYQPWNNALSATGNNSIRWWAKTFIPAMRAIAIQYNCSWVDYFAAFGSVAQIRTTAADGVTTVNNKTVTSASAPFVATDLGSIITGTNIPGGAYIGKINSSTSVDLSSSPFDNIPILALATGTGGTFKIGNDIYGLTIDSGLHFGDYQSSAGRVDGHRAQANLIREKLTYASSKKQGLGELITFTTGTIGFFSGYWQCPGDGSQVWEIEVIAGGGGGGGGGTSTVTSTAQVGGSGGGQGESRKQKMTLTGGVSYHIVIGSGGVHGAGGHAGNDGSVGGDTTFFGPTTLTAKGGGPGKGSATNSTTQTNGGMCGINLQTNVQGFPGAGSTASTFGGSAVGPAQSSAAPGGAGGGAANTTNGGSAGHSGSYNGTATPGANGGAATVNGDNAPAPGATDYGAGGGGGGGGCGTSNSGGNGADGQDGVVYLRRVA